MSPRGKEQRRHSRFDGQITLRTASAAGLGTIEMETANLSIGGAYCLSDRAIPPMTRLQLNIFLPSSDGRPATLHYPIEVTAVVVRSEPLNGNGVSAALAELTAPAASCASADDIPEPFALTKTILPGNEDRVKPGAESDPDLEPITSITDDGGPDMASLAAIDGQAEDLIAANSGGDDLLPDACSESGELRYRLALFFADMAESDRELLSRFLGDSHSS